MSITTTDRPGTVQAHECTCGSGAEGNASCGDSCRCGQSSADAVGSGAQLSSDQPVLAGQGCSCGCN